MARARQRRETRSENPSSGTSPKSAAAPVPASRKPRRIAEPNRTRMRALAILVGAAVIGGMVFFVARRSSEVQEIELPPGLDRAAAEVREHVQDRFDRARESPDDAVRQAELGIALAANGFWNEARIAFANAAGMNRKEPLPAYY